MVYLYRLPYITKYRMFLSHLSNPEEMVYYGKVSAFFFRLASVDHVTMVITEQDMLNLLLKYVKYIDSCTCLGSINHGYW